MTFRGIVVEDLSSEEFSNVYAVSGSPATSVLIGATEIIQPDEQLDLIVSGIAISTRPTKDDESQEYRDHFSNVANFVSRVVGAIGCDVPSLLNTNQALHINYPPLAPVDIKGVRRAEQGRYLRGVIEYVKDADGEYGAKLSPVEAARDEYGDTILFDDGYITIVPIDGEYTATPEFEIDQVLSIDP